MAVTGSKLLHAHNLQDAGLSKTIAMPAAASTTVETAGIDLGAHAAGEFQADHEVLATIPALTTTMLLDTKTMTYYLEDSADDSSYAVLETGQVFHVQTGAGGAGAAAASIRAKLPSNVRRYVRLKATSGADVTDSSAVSMVLALLL